MGINLQQGLLTGLAGILLILISVNIGFYSGNAQRQREISERQTLLKQAQQREVIYRELVKDLTELAVSRKDEQIVALLASQGIAVDTPKTATAEGDPPRHRPIYRHRTPAPHAPEAKEHGHHTSHPDPKTKRH